MNWYRFAVSSLMVACLACASGEELVERNNAAADAIRTNSKAFETAFNGRDVDGMVRLMAEEYIDWNQEEPVWNKTRQRAVWQGVFSSMDARLRVDHDRLYGRRADVESDAPADRATLRRVLSDHRPFSISAATCVTKLAAVPE